MTLGVKSKSDTRNLDHQKETDKHVPSKLLGRMAPPLPSTVVRKRVAHPVTESMEIENDFFIPGTQCSKISLLDLRPRKRNKEDI